MQEGNGRVADEKAAMGILSEVARRKAGGVTVHSVVFNLTDKTVRWVANENYDKPGATYAYSFKTGKLTVAA